jgi:hypothetical protein
MKTPLKLRPAHLFPIYLFTLLPLPGRSPLFFFTPDLSMLGYSAAALAQSSIIWFTISHLVGSNRCKFLCSPNRFLSGDHLRSLQPDQVLGFGHKCPILQTYSFGDGWPERTG